MKQHRKAILLSTVLFVASCARAARLTLQDRFRAISIPAGTADGMVDELELRLSDEDVQDLARYTVQLSRAESTAAAIRSLMQIDNPRAVAAVGLSAVGCVAGFSI